MMVSINKEGGNVVAFDRKLKISTAASRLTKMTNGTQTWGSFCKRLEEPTRTKETFREYLNTGKTRQQEIKDVGGFVTGHFKGGARKKGNIEARDAIVIDGDHFEPGFETDLVMAYGDLEFFYYTTHKHSAEEPRVRLIFPLTRPVRPEEYEPLARKLADRYGMDAWDHTGYEFSRLMYWPSCSLDAEYVHGRNDGAWVDPDKILAEYDDWTDILDWPTSELETKKLRVSADKAPDPREKKGILGAFCRIYSVEEVMSQFIPGTYLASQIEDRYTYADATTANGAVIYDDTWLYSHHESDPCGGLLVNVWDLVRIHKYGSLDDEAADSVPVNRLPSSASMREFVRELEPIRLEMMKETIGDFDDLDAQDLEGDAGDFDDLDKEEEDLDWLTQLRFDDNGEILASPNNMEVILNNDPHLVGCAKMSEFDSYIYQLRKVPGLDNHIGGEWNDTVTAKLQTYLERRYKVVWGLTSINTGLDLASYAHRFHPVRDYLTGVVWDGKPRVETFLIDHLGAQDNIYNRQVCRKFFAAAVARIMVPGTKFDTALILEGAQGKRKSALIEALSGADWFTDNLSMDDMGKTKAIENLRGAWLVEMPELEGFSKSEINRVKAFISRRIDRMRLPYKTRAEDFPRQCVLVGSINESEYLKDATGNRRFWPIKVNVDTINIEAVKKIRDVLWAEAVTLWEQDEPLYLTVEVEAKAKIEQEKRQGEHHWSETIRVWLDDPVSPDYWNNEDGEGFEDLNTAPSTDLVLRDKVTGVGVWINCLGGTPKEFDRKKALDIGRAMKELGWEKTPARRNGKVVSCYGKPV